jgi:exonuclease III
MWLSSFVLLSIFSMNVFADTECPVVTNIGGDRRVDKNKLRLVQYNVEWLFIDYYSAMDCPGDGCTWKNDTEANTHMDYVVKRIADLNPDMINFCEVEGCDELNMLKDKLNDDTYIPYLKKGTDTATGQNVGLLTRIDPLKSLYRTELKYTYPIPGSTCGYTGSPSSSGVSKHYITEFEFNGLYVAFISAHLIAIPTDVSRCAQREAQASVLQTVIVDYISKDYEVIMLGDFNDFDAETMDVNNDKPLSSVLDILKGHAGENAGKYELYNIAETITKNERYSDWWDSDSNCNTESSHDYSMIDHVLVTDLIRKNVINAFIYHEYDEYCGKYDSDHYPVVIDLIF